jgi:hypothetical protein
MCFNPVSGVRRPAFFIQWVIKKRLHTPLRPGF